MKELEEKIVRIICTEYDAQFCDATCGETACPEIYNKATKILTAFEDHVKVVEVENPHPHYVTDITPMMQLTEVHNPMRDEFNRVVQATKRAILGE